ncbi:hypothetical protein HOY82DRAFT_628490 [Tuber indicum]|nr:hypothetical protein HOY82DRAFT_628490 [Tuber indicum]
MTDASDSPEEPDNREGSFRRAALGAQYFRWPKEILSILKFGARFASTFWKHCESYSKVVYPDNSGILSWWNTVPTSFHYRSLEAPFEARLVLLSLYCYFRPSPSGTINYRKVGARLLWQPSTQSFGHITCRSLLNSVVALQQYEREPMHNYANFLRFLEAYAYEGEGEVDIFLGIPSTTKLPAPTREKQWYLSDSSDSLNTVNYYINVSNHLGGIHERSEVMAWLSPLEPRIRHQDVRNNRAEDMWNWLLATDEYRSWYDGSGGAKLFCCRAPGAGKTYVRCGSLVVDTLYDQVGGQNTAVAHFNFNYTSQKEQLPISMLASLLK